MSVQISLVTCPDGSSFEFLTSYASSFTNDIKKNIHLFSMSGWFEITWLSEEKFDALIQNGKFLAWKNLTVGNNYRLVDDFSSRTPIGSSREIAERSLKLSAFK